jgi:hypothetical protein
MSVFSDASALSCLHPAGVSSTFCPVIACSIVGTAFARVRRPTRPRGALQSGHNHPQITAALQRELSNNGPAMLAGGRLTKVSFCSSGSEGVEAAIKFSRAHTGRSGLLYARGAFHGITCGALSLMGDSFWREGFGPLLQAPRRCRSAVSRNWNNGSRRGVLRPSW